MLTQRLRGGSNDDPALQSAAQSSCPCTTKKGGTGAAPTRPTEHRWDGGHAKGQQRPEKLRGGLRQHIHPFLLPQVHHHARLGGSGDSHAPVPLDRGRTWKTDSAEVHCRDVSISQEHLRSLACSCLPSPDAARYCKGYYSRPPSRFYLPIENKKAKAALYCNGHGVIELKCNSS